MEINLTNESNDYKIGERTQIKICYTVKGKKYALALVNTIYNSHFDSYNNFAIYCCDEDSKKICKEYKLPYKESYGIDVYNDKVLNAINESIETKNTAIVAIDILCIYDWHDLRGTLGKLKFKKNTIYYNSYFNEFGDKKRKNHVCGGLLFYYNMNSNMINKYLRCYNKTTINNNIYATKGNIDRYSKNCRVTEESVLTKHKIIMRLKLITREMFQRISHCIADLSGDGLDTMIENHYQYFRFYYLNEEIYKKLNDI